MFKKNIAKLKAFFTKNNELKNKINKEENMSEFQGNNKSDLNYKKVQEAVNKAKRNNNNNNIDSVKANLNNFTKEFESLSNDQKQVELKNEKFQKLSDDIKSLNNNEIKKIIVSMEDKRELSDYEKISKEIEILSTKLSDISKENLQSQEDIAEIVQSKKEIAKISNILDDSFWDKLKQSIDIPKLDLSSITQKIESLKKDLQNNKNDINNSNQALSKKIDNITFPAFPTPPKIPNDYLKKEDFEFIIKDKLQDLKGIKESSEDLESVPAKINGIEKELKNLSEKMDNLPSSNSSQTPKHIPKEEKSVIELAKYMTDGVAQFENIAKEYVSKIGELEKLDKIKDKHQNELEKVRKEEFEKGKKSGKVELIKKLAKEFPTNFKTIALTFKDLIEERFKKDDILNINDDNLNEMLSFIEDKIENGKYKVVSPALLVDNETLFKANVEKVD